MDFETGMKDTAQVGFKKEVVIVSGYYFHFL